MCESVCCLHYEEVNLAPGTSDREVRWCNDQNNATKNHMEHREWHCQKDQNQGSDIEGVIFYHGKDNVLTPNPHSLSLFSFFFQKPLLMWMIPLLLSNSRHVINIWWTVTHAGWVNDKCEFMNLVAFGKNVLHITKCVCVCVCLF